jgi:8-oxo-dGTP pyrophosphatase MutT (NUDIX family)
MSKMKYKRETSAGGIVYKNDGDTQLWLITQHSLHKGWGFPKGIVGDVVENEPMEDAALREVGEEGGIQARIVNPTPVQVSYKYTLKDTLVDKNVFYYLMEYVSGSPDDHDWEVSEAKFISTEEIRELLTFESDKEAFEKILQLL